MDNDRQHLQKLRQHLELIGQKEKTLTDGMRHLADQADELMAEMHRFNDTLGEIQMASSGEKLQEPEPPKTIPELPVNSKPSEAAIEQTVFTSGFRLDRELTDRKQEEIPSRPQPLPTEESMGPPELAISTPDYDSFELNLGIKWLSRIGIVALLIGMAMALSYTFPAFPKELKIATGFLVAAGLWCGGSKLYSSAQVLSRVLQGGGLALGYLSLFAVFFIKDVQLLDFPALGFFLLLAYVAGILALSHRINSQSMSLLSLAFGYYTAGYAVNEIAAFVSTGMLILGAAGFAKLHPKWEVIPKANLLGAFWTYWFWEGRSSDAVSQLYLAYVFVVFHVISVLRAGRGDVVLNVLNTFGCYLIYSWTQSGPEQKGLLEFLIATVQLGTLSLVYLRRPEQRETDLSRSLLLLGLIFGLFGVGRYFDTQQQGMILSALALCFGLLARKGLYQSILQVAAYFTLAWSGWNLILHWNDFTDVALVWNAIWLTVTAFLLEGIAFRAHPAPLRGTVLAVSMLLYLAAIWSAVPSEWRTISMVLSGFVLLATGFSVRRKAYRWMGLAWIFVLGGISLIGDLVMLSTLYKILLFILLGVGLLGGSYGYVQLEKALREQEPGSKEDEALLFEKSGEKAE